ncbi:MAG: hypothetical protein ABIR05_04600 [Luteimonas sp.]
MAGNRLRGVIWGGAAALFLVPLVAMQFTDEVAWTVADFVFCAVMLGLACGAYELGTRLSPNRWYRAGVAVAIVGGFMVVWVNAAVGMIGNEGNEYNLLFLGAILVGAAGALIAWFRAAGMARALYATAIAHGLVSGYALVAGWDPRGALLSLVFVLPWLLSAGLFQKAARDPAIAVNR